MKWLKWIGIILAAVLILPLVTLFALGHRANAGHAHASVEINASPEQIWPWLDDGDKLKQWISWLVEVRESGPAAHAVGANRVLVMKDENNGGMLMEISGQYTEYAPPTLMSMRLSTPQEFDGSQTYHLESLANGHTRFNIDSHYHFANWFANLMEPVVTPIAEKKMVGDAVRLKSLLEGRADATR